jgi:transposase
MRLAGGIDPSAPGSGLEAGGRKDTMKGPDQHAAGLMRLRKYDEAFKQHAVDLTLQSDRKIGPIARELGISIHALYRWRHEYLSARPKPLSRELPRSVEQKDEEIRRLRAEVQRLREREQILKKSLGILSETPGSGMPGSTP